MLGVFAVVYILLVAAGLKLGRRFPKWVQISLIVVLSLLFAVLHAAVAHTQTSYLGFAARNRTPNHPAEIIGYIFAALSFINVALVFVRVRYAAFLLGLLMAAFPVMLFLSL